MHADPPLLDFVDPDLTLDELVESRNEEHDAQFRDSELASALEEVAATGKGCHLPEFGTTSSGAALGGGAPASTGSTATAGDGSSSRSRSTGPTRSEPGISSRSSSSEGSCSSKRSPPFGITISCRPIQRVSDALVIAFPVHAVALRLLDTDAKLHLIAATGLRPSEIRRLALEPTTLRRLELISEGALRPLVRSLGLRWVEIRWLRAGDERIGALTVGARSDRRLSEDDLALLDVAAAQLGNTLKMIERVQASCETVLWRWRGRVRGRRDREGRPCRLRPRELAILRLYAEGLDTRQIAELLVLSVHTVRTHVKNARRRSESAREARHSNGSRPSTIRRSERASR